MVFDVMGEGVPWQGHSLKGGEEKRMYILLKRGLRPKARVIPYIGPHSPSHQHTHTHNNNEQGNEGESA